MGSNPIPCSYQTLRTNHGLGCLRPYNKGVHIWGIGFFHILPMIVGEIQSVMMTIFDGQIPYSAGSIPARHPRIVTEFLGSVPQKSGSRLFPEWRGAASG